MTDLQQRNEKIIRAVIEKANRLCPGSLALVGVYGSFATGDFYEKSDLDLLILANDGRADALACAFIQDDLQIGHDLYCTTWEKLEQDAEYVHPYMAKLLDSKIVYCADASYAERLEGLRTRAREKMASPFLREDFLKAEVFLKEAEHYYVSAMVADTLSEMRAQAGGVIYCVENTVAMLNKTYFRYGVKRAYIELHKMEKKPENVCLMIEAAISADTREALGYALTVLISETARVLKAQGKGIAEKKPPASADALRGTYEEMYSNWRNKILFASEHEDRHLMFMSLCSTKSFLSEAAGETYDTMGVYDPNDLQSTAAGYDAILEACRGEYRKVGLDVKHFADIDAFVKEYLV